MQPGQLSPTEVLIIEQLKLKREGENKVSPTMCSFDQHHSLSIMQRPSPSARSSLVLEGWQMWRRGRVWEARLQPAKQEHTPQHYRLKCGAQAKVSLWSICVYWPVIHRSGSWFPGPPLSPVSWWNCWTCCWGQHSRSCLCTFCGVCWWTHSHKLAAG